MDLIEKAELVAFGYRGAVNARVSREDDVGILTWPKELGHIEIRIKDEAFVVTIRGRGEATEACSQAVQYRWHETPTRVRSKDPMDYETCETCHDVCEAEEPFGDGCLCDTGYCLFCQGSCSGADD